MFDWVPNLVFFVEESTITTVVSLAVIVWLSLTLVGLSVQAALYIRNAWNGKSGGRLYYDVSQQKGSALWYTFHISQFLAFFLTMIVGYLIGALIAVAAAIYAGWALFIAARHILVGIANDIAETNPELSTVIPGIGIVIIIGFCLIVLADVVSNIK